MGTLHTVITTLLDFEKWGEGKSSLLSPSFKTYLTTKGLVQHMNISALTHLKCFTDFLKYSQIPICQDPNVPNLDILQVVKSPHCQIA